VTAQPELAQPAGGSPSSLTGWLRTWSDVELVGLLRRRPDLALPAPVDIATLASRASVRTSLTRAIDGLDAFTLRVLEILALLPSGEKSVAAVAEWFPASDTPAVRNAVGTLRDWLLVWGDDSTLHLAGAVREVLGPYPAGLGRPLGELLAQVNDVALAAVLRRLGLPPATQPRSGASATAAVLDRLPSLIDEADASERLILERLAEGPPIGSMRTNGPRPTEPTAAHRLIERGLLVPVDAGTVELPQEVAFALRPVPAGVVASSMPSIDSTDRGVAVIDGGGCTGVLESVRLVEVLLHAVAAEPVVQLRAGGVGVRDLRRLSRVLDQTETRTALLLEVAYEAGLLAVTTAADPTYLPTSEFDHWLGRTVAQRWVQLGRAWLAMTRLPGLVGERDDRDKSIAALSVEVERHSAPALRLQLMRLLADLAPGLAPASGDGVLAQLAWRSPRRASANQAVAEWMLSEAAFIGVTGYGAITGYARALLDGVETGAPRAEVNAADALDAALPTPVSEFLLQPDLTAVVPGPPTAELARELSLCGDLESSGGASVFRISTTSVRRALDAGRSGSDLQRFFATRSRTPVPQALEYMINDVAAAHGRVRVGAAKAYVRCDDATLLDQVLAEPSLAAFGLQRIAPTVVVASGGVAELLEHLRARGFAPAAESADGSLVSLSSDAPRVAARQHSRLARVRTSSLPDSQLAEVVARLRSSERLAAAVSASTTRVSQEIPGVTSASILEVLRTAVREERTIVLGYVDEAGVASQRTLLPISLGGGVVRGHEPDDEKLRSYPLQRITTVVLLDEE